MRERHREAQEHRDKSNQGTNFFIKTNVVFRRLEFKFYRNKRREVTAMRRVATVIFHIG